MNPTQSLCTKAAELNKSALVVNVGAGDLFNIQPAAKNAVYTPNAALCLAEAVLTLDNQRITEFVCAPENESRRTTPGCNQAKYVVQFRAVDCLRHLNTKI